MQCSGDWIAMWDWDDVWYPQKLAGMSATAARGEGEAGAPGCQLLFCGADVVEEQLRRLG